MIRSGTALVLLASCAGDGTTTTTSSCEDPDMTLTLGTGADSYVALAEGDPVTLVHGPQGGWHIEVSGQVAHTSQEVAILPTITVVSSGDQIAGDQNQNLMALSNFDDASCSGEFFGVNALVGDPHPEDTLPESCYICSLAGELLDLSITVEDFNSGDSVTETVQVIVEPDPGDVEPCATAKQEGNCP